MKRREKALLMLIFLFPLSLLMGAARVVAVGGDNIGIELRTNGLIVTGSYDVRHASGTYNPLSSDIKKGDKITHANQQEVLTIDAFIGVIKTCSESVNLTLIRQDYQINRNLKLYKAAGSDNYRTGLFVKEKVLGIGTVSYYDPTTKTYGALGHQITDSDSGKLFEVTNGLIYDSDVLTIKKSEVGKPGEKVAQIDTNNVLGDVQVNTEFGVFGHYTGKIDNEMLEVATVNQVEKGEAEILTVLNGSKVEKFKITITQLKNQHEPDIKGISFKVIDEQLLKKTNGIVQGMSGSPIVQQGRIIGAVTHVIIDKPATGHGIYLTHMLRQSDAIA